jgi:uncharacterized protein (TIGR00255 family)
MILSMTGYGAAEASSENYKVTIELKSLNSRYLEITLKLPRIYLRYESKLKSILSKSLERGKVILFLNIEVLNPEKRSIKINKVLAKSYLDELMETQEALGLSNKIDLPFLLTLPEVLPLDSAEVDPEEWGLILKATKEASAKLTEARLVEGTALKVDLNERAQAISDGLNEVEKLAPERIALIRSRLDTALAEIRDRIEYDPNRLEQELVFYVEKLDINEEIVRLTQHLVYFNETLESPEGNGKRLNFIAQEMGREINTIGSKAQNAEIQRHVVKMKDELDKIKEQVLNLV